MNHKDSFALTTKRRLGQPIERSRRVAASSEGIRPYAAPLPL